MKKTLILFVILILSWLIKLSYDLFNLSAQQTDLSNTVHAIEQSTANLNDQLVAVQRQLSFKPEQSKTELSADPHVKTAVASNIEPIVFIRQQLELIEFMLQQQKPNEALDKLMHLDRDLEYYALAPSLKQSLHQAIEKDQQTVQQFARARSAQQAKVTLLIHQLDQALTAEINTPQLMVAQAQPQYFWQRWLLIEPAKQPAVALIQRSLILKEAQLRLLLAHQALQQGQYLEYQQALTEIIQLLHKIPDQKARQLIQNMQKIKGFSIIPLPILNTRALVG